MEMTDECKRSPIYSLWIFLVGLGYGFVPVQLGRAGQITRILCIETNNPSFLANVELVNLVRCLNYQVTLDQQLAFLQRHRVVIQEDPRPGVSLRVYLHSLGANNGNNI